MNLKLALPSCIICHQLEFGKYGKRIQYPLKGSNFFKDVDGAERKGKKKLTAM